MHSWDCDQHLFKGPSDPVKTELPITQTLLGRKIQEPDYGYLWGPSCGQVSISCEGFGAVETTPDGLATDGLQGAGGQTYSSSFQVDLTSASAAMVCQAKGKALKAYIVALEPFAQELYKAENTTLTPQTAQTYLENALKQYSTTYEKETNAVSSKLAEEKEESLDQFAEMGAVQGWMAAGTWHWLMSKVSQETNKASMIAPRYIGLDTDEIYNFEEEYLPISNRVSRMSELIPTPSWSFDAQTGDFSLQSSGGTGSDTSESGDLESVMKEIIGPKFETMSLILLDPDEDSIATLAKYGHYMINTSVGVITTYAVVGAIGHAATGNAIGKMFGADTAGGFLIGLVGTFLGFLVVPLMIGGGFLAYYLPAIPFIFWMFGVLGWMIMVAESLVAAPIWAVSHAVPEGEGFAGNAARQGWMLLLNVIFRPILLVIGLFLSMLMMYAIAGMAITGYSIYGGTVEMTTNWGLGSLFGVVFSNIIIVGLIIALSHKAHEMIYETADNVMRWVGGQSRPMGEVGAEQAVSRTYAGAAMYVGQGANASIARGGKQEASNGSDPNNEKAQKGNNATPAGGSEAGNRSTNTNTPASANDVASGQTDTGKSSGVNGGSESGGRKGKEEL